MAVALPELAVPPVAVLLTVWFGQAPVIVTFEPATRPGAVVPVPPCATERGVTRVLPTGLQTLVEVQEDKLLPTVAEVLKNNCPTTQVEGSEVPTVTGFVTGMAEKSGFRPCVLRFTVVFVWPESRVTSQAVQASSERRTNCLFIKRASFDSDGSNKRAVLPLSSFTSPIERAKLHSSEGDKPERVGLNCMRIF